MKEWIFSLVLVSFADVLICQLLPKGENSKLSPPLKLLLSLILVLCVFSPVVRILHSDLTLSLPEGISLSAQENEKELQTFFLEKSADEIRKEVRTNFPSASYTLLFYADDLGCLESVGVRSKSEEAAHQIATFLEEVYTLNVKLETENSK